MAAGEKESNHALVSGASSGIGRAICERLLAEGWSVVGLARRTDAMPVHARFRGRAIDFADLGSLDRRLGEIVESEPTPDLLVAGAAGAGLFGSLEQLSSRQIRETIDLNLTSQIVLCRAVAPRMRGGEGRTIVMLSSESARRGSRRATVYGATKAGLANFAQGLREELATSGVRVSVVRAGLVRTPFFERLEFEPGPEPFHALEPEDVAELVARVHALPDSAVVEDLELRPRVNVVRHRPKSRAADDDD